MLTVTKFEDMEDKANVPIAGEMIRCTSEIEQYRCRSCDFHTNFLAYLKHHWKNGCGHTTQDGKVYRCLSCNLSTHSKYLLLRHGFFDRCSTVNQVKDSSASVKVDQRESKSQNEEATSSCATEEKDVSSVDFENCIKQIRIERVKLKSQQHVSLTKKPQGTNSSQSNSLLRKHSAVNSALPKRAILYKCRICSVLFKLKEDFHRHMRYGHFKSRNNPEHKIKLTPIRLKIQVHFNQNKNTVQSHDEQIKWFQCGHCGYKSKSQNCLNMHITACHSMAGKNIKSILQCEVCPSKFQTKADLVKHGLSKHMIQLFACAHCPYKSKYKFELKAHVKSSHTNANRTLLFKCQFCSSKFKTNLDLSQHKEIFHFGTASSSSRDNGDLVGQSELFQRWFECEICSSIFMTEDILNRHKISRHT